MAQTEWKGLSIWHYLLHAQTYWADQSICWVHRLSRSECVLVCIDLVIQSVCWVHRLTGQGKSECVLVCIDLVHQCLLGAQTDWTGQI